MRQYCDPRLRLGLSHASPFQIPRKVKVKVKVSFVLGYLCCFNIAARASRIQEP